MLLYAEATLERDGLSCPQKSGFSHFGLQALLVAAGFAKESVTTEELPEMRKDESFRNI